MPGIFPELSDNAVVVRDENGQPVPAVGVSNAYIPVASFVTTCSMTALPDSCYSKISPAQINAIVSELVCLAQAWSSTGEWDCNDLCNLSKSFNLWAANANGGNRTINIDIVGNTFEYIRDTEYALIYAPGKPFTLPLTLAGSRVVVKNSGTPITIGLSIFKNDTQIGTIQITNDAATFVFVTETTFSQTDVLSIRAVGSATFMVMSITLLAEKQLEFV